MTKYHGQRVSNKILQILCLYSFLSNRFEIWHTVLDGVNKFRDLRNKIFLYGFPILWQPPLIKNKLILGGQMSNVTILCRNLMIKPLNNWFSFKTYFYFLIFFIISVILLYETGPIQWISYQQCGYWWSGALARGHQKPHCWIGTNVFPVVYGLGIYK